MEVKSHISQKLEEQSYLYKYFKDGQLELDIKKEFYDEYDIKMIKLYQKGYGHNENNKNFLKWVLKMLNYVSIHQKNSIPFIKNILEMTDDTLKDKYILEFGCNTAATAVALALEGSRVIGIDPDPVAIKIGNIRTKKYGLEDKISLRHFKDCNKLDFKNGTFDIVTCVSVLEYITDLNRGKYIAEMCRVLKKGGILFILQTSNGLYPIELHSRKWFINYFPKIIRKIFQMRFYTLGINYWEIKKYLSNFMYIRDEKYDLVERFIVTQGNTSLSRLIVFIAKTAGLLDPRGNHIPPEVFLPWLNLAFKKV